MDSSQSSLLHIILISNTQSTIFLYSLHHIFPSHHSDSIYSFFLLHRREQYYDNQLIIKYGYTVIF